MGFAAAGYDAVRLLALSMTEVKSFGPTEVRAALLAIGSFNGAGGVISLKPDGNVTKKLRLLQVKDGRFVDLPQSNQPLSESSP